MRCVSRFGIIVGIVLIVAAFVVEDKWGREAFTRWFGLAGFTAALFGLFIIESPKLLREWSFWALTAVLLCLHLAAFGIILTHVAEWKIAFWAPATALEFLVFYFLRDMIPLSLITMRSHR
jgi:hypothetical protein